MNYRGDNMLKMISDLKSKFIDLAQRIQMYGASHNFSITTYLENFSARLLSITYDSKFENANSFNMNTNGYDLYNKEKNIIAQVTIEKVNKPKVTNSILKTKNITNYSKILFLFLTFEDKKTYKTTCPIDNEIITLKTIYEECEKNPSLILLVNNLFTEWIEAKSLDFDLYEECDKKFYHLVKTNAINRKYIKDIYIEETSLKLKLRGFSSVNFCNNWLKQNLSFVNKCETSIELGKLGYNDGLQFSIEQELKERKYAEAKSKITSLQELCKDFYNRKLTLQDGTKLSDVQGRFRWGYSSLQFDLSDYCEYIDDFNKKNLLIVKRAGQGKTNLLCDFVDTFLKTNKIPYMYININESNDDIYNYIEKKLVESLQTNIVKSLQFINEYCEASNCYFLIIMDGLNECNNLNLSYSNLSRLLTLLNKYENIKTIMTCRNNSYNQKFIELKDNSAIDLIAFVDDSRRQSRSGLFKNRIIEAYFNYFNIKISLSNKLFDKLSEDTLILRMFCEVYKDTTGLHLDNIVNYKIFKDYLHLRAKSFVTQGHLVSEEELYMLLNKIIKSMIANKNLLFFTIEDFSIEQIKSINYIVDADILIKKEKEDLLTSRYKYSFVYDELRDFLIAEYIVTQESTKALDILKEIDAINFDGIGRFVLIFSKILNNQTLYNELIQNEKLFLGTIFDIDDVYLTEDDIKLIEEKFDNVIELKDLKRTMFFIYKLLYRTGRDYNKVSLRNLTNKIKLHERSFLIEVISRECIVEILQDYISSKIKYLSIDEIDDIFPFIIEILPIVHYDLYNSARQLIEKILCMDKSIINRFKELNLWCISDILQEEED